MSTLPFGSSEEVWLARAICITAISATEPGPEGQGSPAREKQSKGTSISENRKKPVVFVERDFMGCLISSFDGRQDARNERGVNRGSEKSSAKPVMLVRRDRSGKEIGRASCRERV